MKNSFLRKNAIIVLTMMGPGSAAADGATVSGADTAWILTSTALVLFMTLPGLALFYGGLVRTKNVLSVLMQCFAIAGMASIVWFVFGYSLAFGEGNVFIGDFSKIMLAGVGRNTLVGTIPETAFALFQMTFAIINPATIYIAFSRGVPVRNKAAHRRCSHSTARWGNAVCGPARRGLSLNIIGLGASGRRRTCVPVLGKGMTLACALRLVPAPA